MEYCECSLADMLKYTPELKLQESHISAIAFCALQAITYLHQING